VDWLETGALIVYEALEAAAKRLPFKKLERNLLPRFTTRLQLHQRIPRSWSLCGTLETL